MTEIEKSIGEQMIDLLEEEPQHYDVVFSVGPEKLKIKAVRFILKAASPVFKKEFKKNWKSSVIKESDGIPLPDVNPVAFKVFIDLIISDKWCVDSVTSLNLAFATLLNLLELCRRFEITKGIKNLEEAIDYRILTVKDTQEFLEMSRENLETILSCEAIPLDEMEVFDCACRWAEHQCNQKKIELTGENFRKVLGSSFFEIRFPTMKFEIFTKICNFKKNLFTAEEKVAIYDFIGLDDDERHKCDKTLLPFKTIPRNSFGCSVLRLPQQFKITANSPFVCNGDSKCNYFQVNKKISLHGIGFLGPIDGDTYYSVKVTFFRVHGNTRTSLTFKKNVFARKERLFRFLFDKPMVIEPNAYDSSWRYYCHISYSLKGAGKPGKLLQHKVDYPEFESVQISGVEFNLDSSWSDQPVAELLFKLIE